MKSAIIIYHAVDLDGYCSAALFKKYLKVDKINLYKWSYSYDLPALSKLLTYNYIVLLDLTFPFEYMKELILATNKSFNTFIWIDHHELNDKIILDWCKTEKISIFGKRDSSMAACGLCWEYINPSEPMPKVIKLLSDYDAWHDENTEYWENEVVPFQYYAKTFFNSADKVYNNLEDMYENVDNYINDGKLLYKLQQNIWAKSIKGAYKKILKINDIDYNCIVLNTQDRSSLQFGEFKYLYDILICWNYNGKTYSYSFYSYKDNIDCAMLCKTLFNGGGHKDAAGGISSINILL